MLTVLRWADGVQPYSDLPSCLWITVLTGPKAGSKHAELSFCFPEVHSQHALDPSSKFATSTLSTCPKTDLEGPWASILS